MPNLPLAITDAQNWSDSITVALTARYHGLYGAGGTTTITGTADFVWSRVRLADKGINPAVLRAGLADSTDAGLLGLELDPQEFLPVQSALGRVPGWGVLFGAGDPDAGVGAFTRTDTPPPGSGGAPTVTILDVSCDLSMFCTLMAPGRYKRVGYAGQAARDDGATLVELLRAGSPATPTAAAVGNLYRVSFPVGDDRCILYAFSLLYNGESVALEYSPPRGYVDGYHYAYAAPLSQFLVASDDGSPGGYSPPVTIFPRSLSVVDVLMNNYGDTLGSGPFSYRGSRRFNPVDSTVIVQTNLGSAVTLTLPDPFNPATLDHTGNPADLDDYFDLRVSF